MSRPRMEDTMHYIYGDPTATTAGEISRNFGRWQDRAISGPVIVTHHGRPRVVLISAEQFALWKDVSSASDQSGHAALEFETSLSVVLDQIQESFIAFDKDITITAVNGMAEVFYGLPRTRMLGRTLSELFPNFDGSIIFDRLKRVIKSGTADQIEVRSGAFPDRKVRARIFPYPNGAAILFTNITDDRFKAEQLNYAHGYTAALEASPKNSFLSLNVRGAITSVGRRFCDRLGLSSDELDSLRLEDLVLHKDRRRLNATIEHVMQNHVAEACRVGVLTKEEGLVEVEFAMSALSNGLVAEGVYIIGTFVDGGASP